MTSAPASARSRSWRVVASVSWVRVAAMLCTAMGWPLPMVVRPIWTSRVEFLVVGFMPQKLNARSSLSKKEDATGRSLLLEMRLFVYLCYVAVHVN